MTTKRGGSAKDNDGDDGEQAAVPGQPQKPRNTPIDPDRRLSIEEACREAIASGVGSRNSIARAFEVSTTTITRICKAAQPPIVWDRAATKVAVEAQAIDAKARRMAMGELILDRAQGILERMVSEHEVIGWYQGMPSTKTIDAPQAADVKNYAIALGILIDKHAMLVRFDSDDRELSAVDQWLANITDGATTS